MKRLPGQTCANRFTIQKTAGRYLVVLVCWSGAYTPDQHTNTTKGLYIQPQVHAVCRRECTVEQILLHTRLTFRNLASYIYDGRKITLQMPHFIFIQQISVLNILNMLYNLHFFSSKYRLLHNATLFGFYITLILSTGCAKI